MFILDVIDGRIPSDLALGSPDQLEEERRLLYVAMTRARDHLHLVQPLRMFIEKQHRYGDRHVYAPRTRFLTDDVVATSSSAWSVVAAPPASPPSPHRASSMSRRACARCGEGR